MGFFYDLLLTKPFRHCTLSVEGRDYTYMNLINNYLQSLPTPTVYSVCRPLSSIK